MKLRHVCVDCCELGLRAFPIKPTARAIAVGVLRFLTVLKEDKAPEERCDQCGQMKQVFTYPVADVENDPECVHCSNPPDHPIHVYADTGPAGHRFQPKESKAS